MITLDKNLLPIKSVNELFVMLKGKVACYPDSIFLTNPFIPSLDALFVMPIYIDNIGIVGLKIERLRRVIIWIWRDPWCSPTMQNYTIVIKMVVGCYKFFQCISSLFLTIVQKKGEDSRRISAFFKISALFEHNSL